jgi:hypothetical protein
MSGRVVDGNTKCAVEGYFVKDFPIRDLWQGAHEISGRFDDWHKERTYGLRECIGLQKATDKREAVAAKFLDTFLHQLMKYEKFRPLYPKLHLPLDRIVFNALWRCECPVLNPVRDVLQKPPYEITYVQYTQVQDALAQLVLGLNRRTGCDYKLQGRIDLNALLWTS